MKPTPDRDKDEILNLIKKTKPCGPINVWVAAIDEQGEKGFIELSNEIKPDIALGDIFPGLKSKDK